MACYHPIRGYLSKSLNLTGKRSVVFTARDALAPDNPLDLPCGQCIGCRLKRSSMWAGRIVAESQMHSKKCFVTLTYDDAHLPVDGSLHLEHFQDFMKRLRKWYGKPIRFFHCGEYGERFGRPHYHACLFGVSFDDVELWKVHNGERYYISKKLNARWSHGFCVIGDVSFESAAYVARYVTKKVTGERALDHYCKIDYETGEVLSERKPEYCTMSRRPGIGSTWFQKYFSDVYPWDEYIVDGRNVSVPKFFDRMLEVLDPYMADDVKERRQIRAKAMAYDNTVSRRLVKEVCKLRKLDNLKRCYESDGSAMVR